MTDEARITDEATAEFLGRFVSAVQPVLPLVAVCVGTRVTRWR
jgi:hypothetical protein